MPNNNMNFGVDLLPYVTESYDLGSSSKKWRNMYANTVNGLTITSGYTINDVPSTNGFTISGGANTAALIVNQSYTLAAACEKGVTDIDVSNSTINVTSSDSNLITTRGVYYYTTGNYVTIATDQTITGEKLFTKKIKTIRDASDIDNLPEIIAQDSTTTLLIEILVSSDHKKHGLYSNGYVYNNDGALTHQPEGQWLLYRDTDNVIRIGNSTIRTRIETPTIDASPSWLTARNVAPIAVTSIGTNSLAPLASIKTSNGAWCIETYNFSGDSDNLAFAYTSDANYNNNTNTAYTVRFRPDGGIISPGPVILTRTTDASESSYAPPALTIGGASTQQHLEMDGNEILSKSNATTMSTLYIQADGGPTVFADSTTLNNGDSVRFDGGVYFKTSVKIDGTIYRRNTSITKGQSTVSSDTGVSALQWVDSNGLTSTAQDRLGMLYNVVTTSKVVVTRIYAYAFSTATTSNCYFGPGYTSGNVARTYTNGKVYGAVWNDYAEYRMGEITEGGYCVTETPSGVLVKTTERMQPGCRITSDTFGFAIGETDTYQTPIAVSGRVLVYTYRPREEYPLGAALCSAPNGTVDIMTREEIREYPERMIGIVSEIPDYDVWHGGGTGKEQDDIVDVPVNGRIWIYVR